MKKFLILILSIISTLSFVACAGGTMPPTSTPKITVNQAVINIKPYETFDIIATYTGEEQIQYESSNSQVATVDESGRVTGISIGNVIVTVSAGEISKLCYVYVGENTEVPLITVLNAPDNKINLDVSSKYTLDLISTYGAEEIDVAYNYESLDPTIVSVEDGILTANKVGKTQVYVMGSWRNFGGETLVTVIDVTVSNVSFSLSVSEKNIYAVPNYAGVNYVNQASLTPTLKVNGALVNQGFIYESEDDEIVSVSTSGVITGKKVGTTRVYCKYNSIDTGAIYSLVEIKVNAIDGGMVTGDMKDGTIAYISKNVSADLPGYTSKYVDGENYSIKLPNGIVGDEVIELKIDKTEINNVSLDKTSSKLLISVSEIAEIRSGDYPISIVTNVGEFKSNIVIADYVITNATDFKVLQTASEGYYVLGADISGFDYNYKNTNQSPGFKGTFDGKGYSVTDLTHDSMSISLFALMSGGSACVKNVAFINTTYISHHNCAIITNELYGGTIDNVFVSGVTTGASSLVNVGYNKANITNCVVSIKCTRESAISNSAIMNAMSVVGGETTVTNCYVSSNYTGGVAPKSVDSYSYADDNALLDGLGETLPKGYSDYWTIENGNLLFGGKKVVVKTVDLVGAKNGGELFYFATDTTTATDYASNFVENGYYKITMPTAFNATSISSISLGSSVVTDFSYSSGVLKVAVSAVKNIPHGQVDVVIASNTATYRAKAFVAQNVIYSENDLYKVFNMSTPSAYIALNNDITCTKAFSRSVNVDFKGIFDGKGYAVKNFNLNSSGIFNTMNLTKIANVAFINAKVSYIHSNGQAYGFFGNETANTIYENMVITYANDTNHLHGGLVGLMTGNSANGIKIKDVIIVYNGIKQSTTAGFLAKTYKATMKFEMTNSYFISDGNPFGSASADTTEGGIYDTVMKSKFADLSAVKTASNNFNSFDSNYWSMDKNGNLCFVDEIVISAQSK